MSNNDKIILDQILDEQKKTRAPNITSSDFFDTFVSEQVLKNYDLSDEEVESGLIGGGGDGGIDGIYTFANGDLVREDFDALSLKKNVLIEIVIIQSKLADSYNEDAMNRLAAVTKALFDLNRKTDDFKTVYNDGVRSAIDTFRQLYLAIAGRFPRLQFKYIYATRGDKTAVHPNTARKIDDIKGNLLNLFSSAKFQFDFIGATDLLELARQQPTTTYEMAVTECLSSQDGYIALVKLKEFYKFVCDESTAIRKTLFESNVRDYQGSTQVNEEIRKSLTETGVEDFWWLNNGVTVVASKTVQSGKVLTIEDPQIVNGQQTSTEIHSYFSSANTEQEKRCVMVRVIVVSDAASRDKIIKATNSQTSIPPASLRATDKIHRDIEAYLSPFGLYYDRRKNSQKNLGRQIDKIVSIPFMAQATMAAVLQRPDAARARPSSLLKNDGDYKSVFSNDYPIALYFVAAKLTKRVQGYLKSCGTLENKEQTDLLFYVVMHMTAILARKACPTIDDVASIDVNNIEDGQIENSLAAVRSLYVSLGGNDKVAKGSELIEDVKANLEEFFSDSSATAKSATA